MRADTGACACVSARLQLLSSPGNAPDYDCDEDEEDEAHSDGSAASVTGRKASLVGRKMTEFQCEIKAPNDGSIREFKLDFYCIYTLLG